MLGATAMAKKATAPDVKTRQYEAMFLFGANFASEVDKAVNQARGIIERHGGEILVAKKWDERKLAYEIKGNKRGLYVITYFLAPTNAVTGIERDVNLSEDIVRVLVTDASHLNKDEMDKVEPQPIIREERPSWERASGFERGADRPFDERRSSRREPREERSAAEPLPSSRE